MKDVYRIRFRGREESQTFYLIPNGRTLDTFTLESSGLIPVSDEDLKRGIIMTGDGNYTVSWERLSQARMSKMFQSTK